MGGVVASSTMTSRTNEKVSLLRGKVPYPVASHSSSRPPY